MMIPQHYLVLTLGLLTSTDVHSFSTPSRTSIALVRRTRTPFFTRTTHVAGFSTSSYLDGLSQIVETQTQTLSATDAYLNGLSQIVDTTTGPSPEEYLSNVAYQLADISSAVPFDNVFDSGSSFYLAVDATASLGEPASGTSPPLESVATGLGEASTAIQPVAEQITMDPAVMSGAPTATGTAFQPVSEQIMDSTVMSDASGAVAPAASAPVASAGAGIAESTNLSPDTFLSSQLSGLNYGSLVVDDKAVATKEAIAQQAIDEERVTELTANAGDSLNALASTLSDKLSDAKDVGAAQLTTLFGKVSSSLQDAPSALQQGTAKLFEQGSSTLQDVPNAFQSGTNALVEKSASALQEAPKVLQEGTNQMVEKGSLSMQGVGGAFDVEKSRLVEGSSKSVEEFGDLSISDVAHSTVGGLQTVGNTVLKVLDSILGFVSGSSVSELVTSAQMSVAKAVDGAIHSVVLGVKYIGDMTLAEVARSLVTIVITVVKLLFAILSAVVELVSGKDIPEWALAASGTIERGASQLGAQASAVGYDLTHKSLNELAFMVTHFSEDVGKVMAESVYGLGGVLGLDDAFASGSELADSSHLVAASLDSLHSIAQITDNFI